MWHPKAVATAVVLALLSAACYGTASAFQHQATTAIAPEHTLTVGLLTRLVRDWRWLLGNLLDIVGFALQFLALRHGALTLVEPLLVSSLLFSFPLRDLLARRRPSLREALAAAITAARVGRIFGGGRTASRGPGPVGGGMGPGHDPCGRRCGGLVGHGPDSPSATRNLFGRRFRSGLRLHGLDGCSDMGTSLQRRRPHARLRPTPTP